MPVVKRVVEVAPHIPSLAGAGIKHRRDIVSAEGLVDHDERPVARSDDIVEVDIWPAPKQDYHPRAACKAPRGPPTEGVITRIAPNKDILFAFQPLVEVRSKEFGDLKFGDRGDAGGGGAVIGLE